MAYKNKYENMSIIDALEKVNNKKMLLPDVQREYCWEPEDIEYLFESILSDYPIGSCIIWKTTGKIINDNKLNLYCFLDNCKKKRGERQKNDKNPSIVPNSDEFYIVLDGQQRITSMNIALKGIYSVLPKWKKKDKNSWIDKELYYDLDCYNNKDDDQYAKHFAFLSSNEISAGNYYKIKNLIKFKSSEEMECLDELKELGASKECIKDLFSLFKRLNSDSEDALVHYYCIKEDDYDKALDIFVKVNSTGVKLSKTDLLFSTLINGWNSGRDEIEKLLDTNNAKGEKFDFSKDYLMRLCLVLCDCDTNLKIQNFDKGIVNKIRNSWSSIVSSFSSLVDLLVVLGLSDDDLTSYNATMPLAYYIFKGGKFKDDYSKNEARKFISVSLAQGLFGVASNSALVETRRALQKIDCKKEPFALLLFNDVVLTGNRTFKVTESDIDLWLNKYQKGSGAFIFLTLLYPNCKLNQCSFHQDHLHPFDAFENKNIKVLGLDKDTISKWQNMRNLLPNLQLLEASENESKNKTPLKEWVNDNHTFEYWPNGVSLDLKDFELFFEERRKLIKNKFKELFGC